MADASGPSQMRSDNPKFEEWALQAYNKINIEDFDNLGSEDEIIDLDNFIKSAQDTQSEKSASENEKEIINEEKKGYYLGKNNCTWLKQPPPAPSRTKRHNLVVSLPGLRGPLKKLGEIASPVQVWDLLFSEDMVHEVIQWINTMSGKVQKTRPFNIERCR
ncbi:hypothetical protein RN001_004264 [Aquatica leii]|uniref:Uncharacterized protein n=1 Tax=Aquatica leii TaxID=1421715 RepID=A0AAN7P544_9COLE|nr:hypothetical protein RN001_004264 [Aquatica leii]